MPTLTATPQPANEPPRVQLDGATFTGTEVTVLRQDADGRSRPVRTAEPVTLSGGGFTVFDYEAPFGYPVKYTAVPGVESAQVTLSVADIWLRHPGIPDLSVHVDGSTVKIHSTSWASRGRASDRAVHYPAGRPAAVVLTGGRRKGPESTLTLMTSTLAALDRVLALADENVPLLLAVPPANRWGLTYEWISVGDVVESRPSSVGHHERRLVTFPYVVVDRPVGNLQAQWTWAALGTRYASWTEVRNAYDTWADVLADTPRVTPPVGMSPAGWPALWPETW